MKNWWQKIDKERNEGGELRIIAVEWSGSNTWTSGISNCNLYGLDCIVSIGASKQIRKMHLNLNNSVLLTWANNFRFLTVVQ